MKFSQDRDCERAFWEMSETDLVRSWQGRKGFEYQRRVARTIGSAFTRPNEPEIRGFRLPESPGKLASLVSPLFAWVYIAVPLLNLSENALQTEDRALGLAKNDDGSLIIEDRKVQLERGVWKLEENPLARIVEPVNGFDIGGNLREVFSIVAAPGLFS